MLASVLSVLVLISLVDTVCELNLSVLDIEVDTPQNLLVFSKQEGQCYIGTRTAQQVETSTESAPVDVEGPEDASLISSCLREEQSTTSAMRNTTARQADVHCATVGSTT